MTMPPVSLQNAVVADDTIPFNDLSLQWRQIEAKASPDIRKMFETGAFCLGPFVERFHAEGLLKSDFSPVTQVIVAEFMLMVYLTMTPLLGLFNQNEDFDSQESLNQAREFLTNFIVDGLVADPHKPKSSGD